MKAFALAGFVSLALATPVTAQTCPPLADRSAQVDTLLAQIQAAPNEGAARALGGQLWEIWTTAPDAAAQALLDQGMSRFRAFDLERAIAEFDALIAYCPGFAEGYNQRAFANFILQNYDLALADLELALERDPSHVAALAGKALTLMQLGQQEAGQEVLRQALKLNPWLPERNRLVTPPGDDI